MADNPLLQTYRRKRSADGTPEPFGGTPASFPGAPLRFVVHHHAARQKHYDLRLEMDGVLRSWAVPKGSSPAVKDKRFAALVEDHPIEYGDFEGMIPEGNYGAGRTIIWDRGFYIPKGDPVEGLKKGKILFELRGQKLHGMWTLVRMKGETGKEWLFIKETDELADETKSTDDYPMGSVFTGLSLDDLHRGVEPEIQLKKTLGRAGKKGAYRFRKPMLAKVSAPFSRKCWLFEIKYDGYRLICIKEGEQVKLMSRNGNDLTESFPEIAQAVARLPHNHLVIDGEAVVHAGNGLPSFARLQKRGRLTRPSAIARATLEHPATLYAFDLLHYADRSLEGSPLTRRKELLQIVLPAPGMIRYSDHIEQDGNAMYEAAASLGLEGIVAKKKDSKYTSGRSDNWKKIRVEQTDDFVIMGYKARENGDIRSLAVGQYTNGELVYSGQVGSGLDQAMINELLKAFAVLKVLKKESDTIWVEPELAAEVRYKEFTPAGQLRHPVILRLRDDKPPEERIRWVITKDLAEPEIEDETPQKEVHLSNQDKVFWPQDNYTKGDLVSYYDKVAPWILPWLKDRPLVMTRFPDGIEGKYFFQKNAPGFVPDWIRIEKMWSESTEREISYLIVDSVESLVYVANMASNPLHIHHSRLGSFETPDWCVLDLDPKEAPFKDVITIARAIKRLCDDIGLPAYLKTSGSTGLHILIPLGGQFTFEQSRTLGELLGRVIVGRLPDIATIIRNPEKRDGRVYIDYLQNGTGKLIAAPYCVRPLPGAPVSMPIGWKDLTANLTPRQFTIKNAFRRLGRIQKDPAIDVLDVEVDLLSALETLSP